MTALAFAPRSAPALPSAQDLLARYGGPVPRYTSYPTAPHFGPQVDAGVYGQWLAALPADVDVSLYLHVPFCAELCLYCGCQTSVARTYTPVAAFTDRLLDEIALMAEQLPHRLSARHIHFGGGTPTMLSDADFTRVMTRLRSVFDIRDGAEIAIEIDPRVMDEAKAGSLARNGVNRVSLGVQDFELDVQKAIRRMQSFEETAQVAAWLRAAGIPSINLDLIYGLPRQTLETVARTVQSALELEPDRIAVFGYAHVPWMKRHQALIPEDALPGPSARLDQASLIAQMLNDAGYVSVGLDHFAQPHDSLAAKAVVGALKRNFQGYTTDDAPVLLGFGPSSIGALPQGYVQNIPATPAWHKAVAEGILPVARGRLVTAEDRLRRDVIERLMCDLCVDLAAVCARHDVPLGHFDAERAALAALEADSLVELSGNVIRIPEAARSFTRVVCAVFDTYLPRAKENAAEPRRHSAAV